MSALQNFGTPENISQLTNTISSIEFPDFSETKKDTETLIQNFVDKPAAEILVPFYKPDTVLNTKYMTEKFFTCISGEKLENNFINLVRELQRFSKVIYPENTDLKDLSSAYKFEEATKNLEFIKKLIYSPLDSKTLPSNDLSLAETPATFLAKDILRDLVNLSEAIKNIKTFDDLITVRQNVLSIYLKISKLVSKEMVFSVEESSLSQNRSELKECIDVYVKCFGNLLKIIAFKKNANSNQLKEVISFLDYYTKLDPDARQKYRQPLAFIVGSTVDEMLIKENEAKHGTWEYDRKMYPNDKPSRTRDEIGVLSQTMLIPKDILKIIEEQRSFLYISFLKALDQEEIIELIKFGENNKDFQYQIKCNPKLITRPEDKYSNPNLGDKFSVKSLFTDKITTYTWKNEANSILLDTDGLIEYFLYQVFSSIPFQVYNDGSLRVSTSKLSYAVSGHIVRILKLLGCRLKNYEFGYVVEIPETENINFEQKMTDKELSKKLTLWLMDKARNYTFTERDKVLVSDEVDIPLF